MKNIILSPKSSLTPTFLGEILSPKVSRENWEREWDGGSRLTCDLDACLCEPEEEHERLERIEAEYLRPPERGSW
jgi:hypothetical protein